MQNLQKQSEDIVSTLVKAKESVQRTLVRYLDPSTFSMTLSVLRPEDGDMIKFTKYPMADDSDEEDDSIIVDFGRKI